MMAWSDWKRIPDCLAAVHLAKEWLDHVQRQGEPAGGVDAC